MSLVENQDQIHATVVCSCLEDDKNYVGLMSLTYKALEGLDFIPVTYDYDNPVFPLFAKDDEGQGGRNTHKISSRKELDKLKEDKITYVLCEYLPGRELTIDCFTDRYGKLRFAQPRYRERLMNGITARTSNAAMTDEIQPYSRFYFGTDPF